MEEDINKCTVYMKNKKLQFNEPVPFHVELVKILTGGIIVKMQKSEKYTYNYILNDQFERVKFNNDNVF